MGEIWSGRPKPFRVDQPSKMPWLSALLKAASPYARTFRLQAQPGCAAQQCKEEGQVGWEEAGSWHFVLMGWHPVRCTHGAVRVHTSDRLCLLLWRVPFVCDCTCQGVLWACVGPLAVVGRTICQLL